MPSFKWELFWQKIPPWTSPEPIWSFFFLFFYSNFDSNLMLSDSVLLLSSLLYSRVVKYHFFFVVFACFWCFWCNHSRMRKCKVCGKNRDTQERNLGPIQEKRSNLPPCCSRNSSNPDSSSQTKESWTSGPIFWRCWECSQHFLKNAGVQTDRGWCEPLCHWPQVNYQESGRECRRLAHNWLHQHAHPLALHSSWFSPDLESRREKWSFLQALVSECDMSIHRICQNYIRVVKFIKFSKMCKNNTKVY